MPPKKIKLFGGREVEVKSWLLPTGNLLILQRKPKPNRDQLEYVEVSPGTSDYKRWYGVHVIVPDQEPDPRG